MYPREIMGVSEYFNLYELAEGIYGAVEKKEAGTGSNAGIIDLGGSAVIFDTFLNLNAARDLRSLCKQLTGRDADFIINSHYHIDHIVGNCAFDRCTKIISSSKAKAMMEKDREEYIREKHLYNDRLREIEELLSTENDSTKISDLKNERLFAGNLANPEVEIRLPDVTVDGEFTLYGSKRNVKFSVVETAHSPGDIFAIIPEERICFAGDLLFSNSHPWLGSGSPEGFLMALEDMLKHDVELCLPGHGEISNVNDIKLEREYIAEIMKLVSARPNDEASSFNVKDLPPPFDSWSGPCFPWNIDFLLKRVNEK